MNQYTQLLMFIKELAEAHPLVNTVTQGRLDTFDLNKANIYQIVHVSVDGGNFTNGQVIVLNVTLTVLQQRDINKEVVRDHFWANDNETDNMNETLATLNAIWTKMKEGFSGNNITSSENPSLDPIIYEKTNILDGWSLNFDVELPNTTLNLCQ